MTNIHHLPVPPRKAPPKRKARRSNSTPSKPDPAPLQLLAAVAAGTAGALLIALGLAIRLVAA